LSEGRKTETEPQSTKKKTMKTITEKKTKSGLKNRPEPLSTASQRQIDFRRRAANRSLETGKLLARLASVTPKFFELAEVVWIQFTDKQPVAVARILAELGFHWNKARQSWQHPCGLYREQASRIDPRQKYGCYLASSVKIASNNESDLLQFFSTVREKKEGIWPNLVRG
jgi:hypothetical protein